MTKRTNKVYIDDMIRACDNAIMFASDKTFETFVKDRMCQSAVVREVEIIGEASKKLSAELKKSHAQIPWKLIGSMRDRLIHDYFDVDFEVVWNTVKNDLPELRKKIAEIMAKL